VALPFIWVLDDSPAIRETVAILLGADYEIEAAPLDEFQTLDLRSRRAPDLLIAGDSEGARKAVRSLPGSVRILWLARSDSELPVAPDEASLPRRFSPHELRTQVERLLARPASRRSLDRARRLLQPPFVPAETAPILAQATTTDLPLLLQGEPGVGRRRVARAVHELRDRGTFFVAHGSHVIAPNLAEAAERPGTLYIDSADQLSEDAQQGLLSVLEPNGTLRGPSGRATRLICSSTVELAELVDKGGFSAELYYRIGILSVRLPPLRDRTADLPDLARAIAEDLRTSVGEAEVRFAPAALERLSLYLWFGNLTELEAVLVRTLSICRKPVIDADDLLFDSRAPRLVRPGVGDFGTPPASRGLSPENLDLVINELAHEFKNPLVTIKTFAQHVKKLLDQGSDDRRFAQLTGDAVDQMDHALENLLRFTRMDAPSLRTLSLEALVTPVADDLARALAEQGARLRYEAPPPVAVSVDPEQVDYALRNLLRALSRDLGARQGQLLIRFEEPAGIVVQLPRGCDPLGSHLARLTDHRPPNASPLPLGVAIASAVLERNHAQVLLPSDASQNTVTVRFAVAPNQEEAAGDNGKTPRTHR
jgi:DNA-binding NtrC family response regulator